MALPPPCRAALALHTALREVKQADWPGNRFQEREVRSAVEWVLGDDDSLVDTVFKIVRLEHAYSLASPGDP